jgi:3-keto-5-aminohexanoate cleavage enzyme
MKPLVITAAICGAEVTRVETPYVPYTADELAAEAKRCRDAGAAMIHLHVRRDDGTPTQDAETFRRAILAIRERVPDVIVQTSTGGAVGMSAEERAQPLTLTGPAKPDMATLTGGTCNFGDDVFENPLPLIRKLATMMKEAGIRPEFEIFDAGMIDTVLALAKKGLVELPGHFDFVLGVPGALTAKPTAVDFLRSELPAGCTWTVAGVGRHELPMAELAIGLGGNVRVGLEDNIFADKGVLAKGSSDLVARVAEMAQKAGRPLATPAQARELLRLPTR